MSNDSGMPERIWAGLLESVDFVRATWQMHEPKKKKGFEEVSFEDVTEYIRVDIHQREIERLERELEKANEWNERHKTRIRKLCTQNSDLKKLNKGLRKELER